MRIRPFLILSAVTLAVTLAAGIVVSRQERAQSTIVSAGAVFPGLVDRLGEVTAVVVRSQGRTLTLQRIEGGWGLAERNGYPVDTEMVRDLVRSLVQLEKAEAKTVRPESYPRLGVEDVEAPGAKSTEVTLQAAAGTPIAKLIVGNAAVDAGAEGATYVRIPGDPQSWLARGTVPVRSEARDWVQRRLIEIPAADIRELRVVHPDKSTVTLVRSKEGGEGAEAFGLAEVPPAKLRLKRPDGIEAMAEALTDLTIDDLADAGTQNFPADKTIRVKVTRTDGAVVAFDVVEQQNFRWLRFADGAAPASLPVAGRALIYRVPAWKVSPLERKLADLLETAS